MPYICVFTEGKLRKIPLLKKSKKGKKHVYFFLLKIMNAISSAPITVSTSKPGVSSPVPSSGGVSSPFSSKLHQSK